MQETHHAVAIQAPAPAPAAVVPPALSPATTGLRRTRDDVAGEAAVVVVVGAVQHDEDQVCFGGERMGLDGHGPTTSHAHEARALLLSLPKREKRAPLIFKFSETVLPRWYCPPTGLAAARMEQLVIGCGGWGVMFGLGGSCSISFFNVVDGLGLVCASVFLSPYVYESFVSSALKNRCAYRAEREVTTPDLAMEICCCSIVSRSAW